MGLADLAPGDAVDGFAVGPCLHEGAMGKLFEVTGPATGFPMLMKVPKLGGAAEAAETLIAFETEAMILPRLEGPHAPRFVAAGDVATVPYIVTERIDGESLDRRARPLDASEIARIGASIADALHDIHAQGVVHLDLKPDNVVMRRDGAAVLVDFALAHHRELPDLLAQERRYTAGSAPYVSPEQVRGSRSDPRSDLFALGVMLYELATGELPFGVPRTFAGLRDRLWIDPAPPIAHVPGLHPALQEIILRCLEADPARRYQSASHVAFDLRNLEQVPLTARSHKRQRVGLAGQAMRWWRARDLADLASSAARDPDAAPVVMVAVDTMHPDDPRQPDLQRVTSRILSLSREFRLICVAVVSAPIGGTASTERDVQVEHRIRLRHWLAPLRVEAERVSMHVLEGTDPGAALVEFATLNNVDLIVLGAPAPDERALAWWRSVASTVTANARCSVHVVRRAAGSGPAGGEEGPAPGPD
ncbi:MAG TPA: bifunctional serine/threonine-protein kinase/universal stress protein [Usitatibacter sp.]|nr:bifunctional serine/threonine-protein kinase/universal stress protein [Usitatibacter sp.]